MGYLFVGLGALGVDPFVTPPDMEFVAIPEGTTIRFFADWGMRLRLTESLDLWAQIQEPWPALDCSRLTYNLCLYVAPELEEIAVASGSGPGTDHTVLRADEEGLPDPFRMCTGTPTTCPTRPRQIASGATHECDGVLSRYGGDLHWLACTPVDCGGAQRPLRSAAAAEPAPGCRGKRYS